MSHSSTVKILATSREGLRLADEQLWPVPSLDVRAASTHLPRRCSSSARRLSRRIISLIGPTTRMRSWRSAVAWTAFRWRSSWPPPACMSMTVTEVRDRLDDRFRLLVGSRRGLERHQTLAPCGAVVLRPARRRRKVPAGNVFGVRRRIRPCRRMRRGRLRRRFRHPGPARCPDAQVASGRRQILRADPILDVGDHPAVRRRTTRGIRRCR